MKSLKEFYQDTETRDIVHEYLEQFFKEEAVKRLMNREDAVALADATEMLNAAFENMDIIFQGKQKSKENINQSR